MKRDFERVRSLAQHDAQLVSVSPTSSTSSSTATTATTTTFLTASICP
jgi:hypothetical protein